MFTTFAKRHHMVRERITIAELRARLNADPNYLKMMAEKEAAMEVKVARWRAEQALLLQELKAVGWNCETVWDLVNTATPYREAVPILLRHLKLPYSDRIREGIARSLAIPDARSAWPALLAEYQAAPKECGFKSGLAVALSVTATDAVINELVEVAKDKENGSSRVLLLRALKRSRSPIAHQTLEDLKDDPDVAPEIAIWRKRKARKKS